MDSHLYGISTISILLYSKRFELPKTIDIGILLWWCDKSLSYAWYVYTFIIKLVEIMNVAMYQKY